MKTQTEQFLHIFIAPAIRSALVAFSGWLAANQLPTLQDPTIDNLLMLVVAAASLFVSWLWSQWDKVTRRRDDLPKATAGASTRFTLALSAGAMIDSQAITAIITILLQYLWSVLEKKTGKKGFPEIKPMIGRRF